MVKHHWIWEGNLVYKTCAIYYIFHAYQVQVKWVVNVNKIFIQVSFLNTDYQCKLTPFVDQSLSAGDVDYQDHVHIGQSPKDDRVLCLDGGGIKGLILINMLITTERIANKKITELLDWIIGTSTGGILALAMVYSELHFPMCKHIILYKQKH